MELSYIRKIIKLVIPLRRNCRCSRAEEGHRSISWGGSKRDYRVRGNKRGGPDGGEGLHSGSRNDHEARERQSTGRGRGFGGGASNVPGSDEGGAEDRRSCGHDKPAKIAEVEFSGCSESFSDCCRFLGRNDHSPGLSPCIGIHDGAGTPCPNRKR